MDVIKILYLTRHGEAEHNNGSTFAGARVDTPLVDQGIISANEVAAKISADGGAKLVVTSKLLRSRQTGKIIAQQLSGAKLTVVSILNEIDAGDFTGLDSEQVKKMFPIQAEAFYSNDIENWQFPNGEGFAQLDKRVEDLLDFVVKQKSNPVVLCSHGMFIRVILHKLFPDFKSWTNSHDKVYKISLYADGSSKLMELQS